MGPSKRGSLMTTNKEGVTMKTRRSEYGKIINSGMGGFLNPPTHPEHTFSVHSTDGDTFSMSLSSAAAAEWLEPRVKARAKGILKRWTPLPLEDQQVKDWIYQVLGYFSGCYRGEDGSWNASDLKIDKTLDPIANADKHAGVNCIRKYYPEYVPTADDFKNAYWGTKGAN
jgi:hypothetical protein